MADANVTFGADGSAFTKTIAKMGKDLATGTTSMTARLARLGQAFQAVSMAWSGIKSVGSFMKESANAILAPAAQTETLTLSLQTMLGGEVEALRFMEKLNDYAAKTPFELDGISQAAKVMLANTSLSAEEVMTQLERIGNLSAGTGKGMQEIAQVYAKAMNVGVTNEVAESFETMGIPIRKMIAELKGISFEEVFAMISKRQIGAEDLNAALMLLTEHGGKFDGMTDKLSQSFEGLTSTLEDNLNAAVRTFGEELLPQVKPALEALIETVDKSMPYISELGAQFGEWLGDKVQNGVIPSLGDLSTALPELAVHIKYAAKETLGWVDTLLAIPRAIGAAVDVFKKFVGQIAAYNAVSSMSWEEAGKFAEEQVYNKNDRAKEEELAAIRAAGEEMRKNAESRRQQRFEEAQAADELAKREKESAEQERARIMERERLASAARAAEKQAETDRKKLIQDNAKELEKYYERRAKWERDQAKKKYDKQSIAQQESSLRAEGASLGVAGNVSPESIRARMDALAQAGAAANEKEIAALERLLEKWAQLTERKEEYSKTRQNDMMELRAGAMEAAGNTRGAAALREQMTVAARIEELKNAGASAREAREQALAEQSLRQANAISERIKQRGVEFIQSAQAAEGGGGVSLRIGGATLEESRRQTKLLQDVYRHLRSMKTGSSYAVLA